MNGTSDSSHTPAHSVEEAYQFCADVARRHYENFPVASLFIPKRIRPAVAAIYAFARTADDFADEGKRTHVERLELLNDWQSQLDMCFEGDASHPIFVALAHAASNHNLPRQLFSDLLTAFRMDVTKNRYQTFDEVLYYCKHSANPVGRLVLHLFNDASEENCLLSDNICTALQLANFWQDITIDLNKNRIYMPLEDAERFSYTENELRQHVFDDRFESLMKFQVERTRELFDAGKPLLREVRSPFRFELSMTWNGGMTILEKIEKSGFNVFQSRPTISTIDKFLILGKAFFQR